jgi:transcription elongation factor Elf1
MKTCPHCQSQDIVGFTLAPKGHPLHFSHCRSCEHRWWVDVEVGNAVRLPDVLDQIGGRAA